LSHLLLANREPWFKDDVKMTGNTVELVSEKPNQLCVTLMNPLQDSTLFFCQEEEAFKRWHTPYARLFQGYPSVVDLGCGQGTFLDLVRAQKSSTLGIDPDPQMVKITQQRGHNVLLGDQTLIGQFSSAFHGIHISHVIEHMWGEQAIQLIKDCAAALQPGGMLVIRTPNWENQIVRNGAFWLDHTHCRPYPLALLQQMIKASGFKITACGYEPFGLEDIYLVCHCPGEPVAPLVSTLTWINSSRKILLSRWLQSKLRNWFP
jgi:SAM-dependent methyltransferase